MHERAPAFSNDEENREVSPNNFKIIRITDGLDFGHGAISGSDDEPEVLSQVDSIIHNSGDILVPVDKDSSGKALDDDGCGDGREAVEIFSHDQIFKKSLNRAKVFGGSTAMTAAALVGTGEAKQRSLSEVFELAVSTLEERDIDFGAHTDEHAAGDNCGCGAIDKAPEAIWAALKYKKPIKKVIKNLGVDTGQLNEVYASFGNYVGEMPGQEPYSGRKVMDRIIGAGKVIKKLGGEHRERRIILNMVRGFTVNQQLIRQATEGRAQAFAVDLPRLEDIAANLFPGQPDKQAQTYLSELIYTLSTAAVLTKGDLPVYMIREASPVVTA